MGSNDERKPGTPAQTSQTERAARNVSIVVFGLIVSLAVSVAPVRGQTGESDSSSGDLEGQERPEAEAPEAPMTEPQAPPPKAIDWRTVEEIIVTAQKREQSLHEVPISMTVMDDDFLGQQSLTDLSEVSQYVPNVKVLPPAFVPRANMRGFGIEESNKGLDSPVGLVIDGVSYGNNNYLQTGFFDVDRIEVLRGPQNALYGRSNSVGLFNMTTKDPTDDFTGVLDLSLGEPDRERLEAAVGGPVLPGIVNFRIAGLSDARDGFSTNTTADVAEAFHDIVRSDRKAARIKAELPNVLGADVVLSYEKFSADYFGTGFEFSIVPEGTRPLFLEFDPKTDFEFGNFVQSSDYPSVARIDIDTFVADASYDLGDWQLDAVVGHSVLSVDNVVDADLTPAPIILAFTKDTNPQTTFELRSTSPRLGGLFGLPELGGWSLGWTDFTAGLFYQHRQVTDSEFTASFDTALIGGFAVLGGFPPPPGVPVPPMDMPITRETVGQNIEETTMFWEQTAHTVAVFSQASWHFAEGWTLIPGMRLGNEWKEADWERVFGEAAPVFLNVGGFEEFTAHLERSELQYAPRVNLRYDLTDDVNVFATWARGFRGGGFNEFAAQDANLEFDPETTTNWELGTNMDLLDGAARLGLVFFRTTITDFQLLTDDPDTGFNEIKNAGEARARGIEAEGNLLPTSWLALRGALGLNDSEYLDFPFGPCNVDTEDSDGDGDPRCDLTGKGLHQAPEWVVSFFPSVRFPLGGIPFLGALPLVGTGLDLIGGLALEYKDTQLLDATLDPRTRQDSFFRLDSHIGFQNLGQGWTLRFTGQNLTDQIVADSARQVSLLGGHFVRGPEPPRHFFGELRWSF